MDSMAEKSNTSRAEQPEAYQEEPDTETDESQLFHDGSLRCSKCVDIVQHLGKVENRYIVDEDRDEDDLVPEGNPPNKFKYRRKHYEPVSPCITCQRHIGSREYHKLGDHLLEAHESPGKEKIMPKEGCCYLCLILFQFKCRNGFQQSKSAVSAQEGRLTYSGYGLARLGYLHFFSHSINKPVNIDRYLPQGFKGVEGNTIRIMPRQKIHWPSVRLWLLSCEKSHGCDRALFLESKFPRVIERIFIGVKHERLVNCSHNCRYIALSYVWGGIPQLLLTKSNKAVLFQDGALREFEKDIPQVIKDAMLFVHSIGEEMLWVDSLCIVQDDESVKHDLISDMASIYSGALATIITASGENAGFGLPGVRENSRVLEHLVEIPGTGLSLRYRRTLNTTMNDSTYNTRGWTFQERLLSRRCLYFTDTQLFFECQEHLYSEDRFGKQTDTYPHANEPSGYLINKMLLHLGDSQGNEEVGQLLRYSKLVEEYCHKKFTFIGDILNAFAGIEAAMEKLCGWAMVYGLPEQILDRAILWEPEGDVVSRPVSQQAFDPAFFSTTKAETSLSTTAKLEVRSSEFPSWSWSAWTGGIHYNEWTVSDLLVLHYPFQLVHPSGNHFQGTFNNHHKPSVLSFSSECVPASKFSLKNIIHRNRHTCLVLNTQGQNIGTIPGVKNTFAEDCDSSSVDLVLLSASKLTVHRFRSQEDMGYPSIFDVRFPRNDWSVLTVMFVKWDKGYAKRIALAYIHRDAWKEADPRVKPVLLT